MQALSLDKKIDEARNYFLEEIKHNELISKKYKKTGKTLNYAGHLLVLLLLLLVVFQFLLLLLSLVFLRELQILWFD